MAIDFRHPEEQGAWQKVAENPVFKFVVDAFQSIYMDLTEFAQVKGRNFLVTKETYPELYRLYRIASERVGVEEEIPLYLNLSYSSEIETIGTDSDCFILISSDCLENCSDKQILALLGEELAHIRYEHIRLLNIHKAFELILRRVPFANVGIKAFKILLLNWKKYALMTADRGAAIAAADGDSAVSALTMRMGTEVGNDGIDALLSSYEQSSSSDTNFIDEIIGKTVFELMMDKIAVPFGMLRISEIKKWCASEECREQFSNVFFGTQSEFGYEKISDASKLYNQYNMMKNHNPERALAMLHMAAELGSVPAQSYLGRCYMSGKQGLSRNCHEGLSLLRKAALAGDLSAQFSLGCCFKTGCENLLQRDDKKAQWLFRLADDSGYSVAKKYLDDNSRVKLDEQTTVKIMSWFANACKEGSCKINSENPTKGICYIPEVNGEIYRYLWVPQKEKLYAYECEYDYSGNLKKAIAVGETGVYIFAGMGIPFYMTWSELSASKVEGLRRGSIIRLNVNENYICNYCTDSDEREIGKLITKIKVALNEKT